MDERVDAIGRSFGWLREHGYAASEDPSSSTVTYERDLVALVVQIRVSSPSNDEVAVTLRWPDQAYSGQPIPTLSLGDLEAMLGSYVPDTREGDSGSLSRASARLDALARDAVHGSLSVMFDALFWHWRQPTPRSQDDWWGVPPYDDPEIRVGQRRSRGDFQRDLAFCDLKLAWRADPRHAWPGIVSFVRRHPQDGEAEWLLEDVILEGGDEFVDLIVAVARSDGKFAETVRGMHLGGFAGPAVERIELLQRELGA